MYFDGKALTIELRRDSAYARTETASTIDAMLEDMATRFAVRRPASELVRTGRRWWRRPTTAHHTSARAKYAAPSANILPSQGRWPIGSCGAHYPAPHGAHSDGLGSRATSPAVRAVA